MSNIAWICLTILVVLILAAAGWDAWALWQAAQKKQTAEDAAAQSKNDTTTLAVEQSMAQAQATAPADDADVVDRLSKGNF